MPSWVFEWSLCDICNKNNLHSMTSLDCARFTSRVTRHHSKWDRKGKSVMSGPELG